MKSQQYSVVFNDYNSQHYNDMQHESNSIPTYDEVTKIIQLICRKFPNKSIVKIIEQLKREYLQEGNKKSQQSLKIQNQLEEMFMYDLPFDDNLNSSKQCFENDLAMKVDIHQENIGTMKKQEQKKEWTDQITLQLVNQFIKNSSSLTRIRKQLINKFESHIQLLTDSNIMYHLDNIFKRTLQKITVQMDRRQCIQMGSRFKRMIKIDQKKYNQIISCPEANTVRTTLCEYSLQTKFDTNQLIRVILEINEFLNKKKHQEIAESLKQTKEENSINRPEYQFAGKRKKVLKLKHYKKTREPRRFQ